MKCNHIEGCLVTVKDIQISEKMFVLDVHALTVKTVHRAPLTVIINEMAVPRETLELHKDAVLGINFEFVNGLCFFMTVSSKITCVTMEHTEDKNIDNSNGWFEGHNSTVQCMQF